jgi:hypothetical protein
VRFVRLSDLNTFDQLVVYNTVKSLFQLRNKLFCFFRRMPMGVYPLFNKLCGNIKLALLAQPRGGAKGGLSQDVALFDR